MGWQLTLSFSSTSNLQMAKNTAWCWEDLSSRTWCDPVFRKWRSCFAFVVFPLIVVGLLWMYDNQKSFALQSIRWYNALSLRFSMFQLFPKSNTGCSLKLSWAMEMTAQWKWYLSERVNAQPDVICLKTAAAWPPRHSNKMLPPSHHYMLINASHLLLLFESFERVSGHLLLFHGSTQLCSSQCSAVHKL